MPMTVVLKDDPEIIRQYEEYHANPFPETNEGLLRVGVQRMYHLSLPAHALHVHGDAR